MNAQTAPASWVKDGDAVIEALREFFYDMVGEKGSVACIESATAPAPRASVYSFSASFADEPNSVSLLPAIVASRPVIQGWHVSLIQRRSAALTGGLWRLHLRVTCWRGNRA